MIVGVLAFIGGIIGLVIRAYLRTFALRLTEQIQQSYIEIFPQTSPHFEQTKSSLMPIKCGHFLWYFGGFSTLFLLLALYFTDWRLALIYGIYCSLLYYIAVVDWHYQLISLTACQLLLSLGIFATWQQITPFFLDEVLTSVCIGFASFYGIYHLARYFYKHEALGQGDYWLVAGLSSFMTWQDLPLFVFIACVCGLLYVVARYKTAQPISQIPFAPFLCLSSMIVGIF